VAIWRGDAATALATSRAGIAHLFADGEDDGVSLATLWEEMDLPEGADRLLYLAGQDEPDESGNDAASPSGQKLDTATLQALEGQLAQADMAHFARRHPVCARQRDGSFRLRWEKRSLCIDEIAASLAPQLSLQADPWLFLRLTRTLDRRMLALLSAPGELTPGGAFAINLNTASILSPSFLKFDAALPTVLRGQVTLDVLPADVMADPAAFLFARDFARARGYRLLLRNVSAEVLAVFPLARMGLDWIQLRWSPAFRDAVPPLPAQADQLVLGHADGRDAIEWGAAHGISLFQGAAITETPKALAAGT
jgi:hypothetical protein